jgi:hypothetical protein
MMTSTLLPVQHDRFAQGAYRRASVDRVVPMIEIEAPRGRTHQRHDATRLAPVIEPAVGFTAQSIAQELFTDGAHIEDHRPAVAAYAAGQAGTRQVDLFA